MASKGKIKNNSMPHTLSAKFLGKTCKNWNKNNVSISILTKRN